MIVSNGVRVGADYKTIISGDGATVNSGDGRRLTSLNRWGMIWDGHHFAPPDSGSVLYYPGNPGMGSTITDFSRSFSDSGINTAEPLNISELDVDVDGDPTSVISTGDVIRIDNELMYVTSSAQPILVLRGYEGSHAAIHDTSKGIYVRTKNDGTITQALWMQLPSGLLYLDYDGDNDFTDCGRDASLNMGTGNFTLKSWIWSDTTGASQVILNKGATGVSGKRYRFLVESTNEYLQVDIDDDTNNDNWDGATAVTDGVWHHVGVSVNRGGNGQIYLDGATTGTAHTMTATLTINDTTKDLCIGVESTDETSNNFNGGICLEEVIKGIAWSTAQFSNSYNQERHLFGV